MLSKAERESRYILSLTNISFKKFQQILKEYGSASKYKEVEEISANKDNEIKETFVVYGDKDYPKLLLQIPFPPIALSFKGDISLANNPKIISIVGTRKNSSYGARITKRIVQELAKFGYIFVSGMALGIDTIVHETALESGSKTIAILPTTLDSPLPRTNHSLSNEIAKNGLLLAEPKYKYVWNKYLYAKRNRIIAGISPITLVTEAPEKSGALITANLAFEYNREVYAIPGNIDSSFSVGCNWLIKMNKAQLFTHYHDIIPPQLQFLTGEKEISIRGESNSAQNHILRLLQVEELSLDDILYHLEEEKILIERTLLELEIQGIICLNRNGKYNIKIN